MDIHSIQGISLFSGVGGIDLGLKLAWANYRTVCYVENDPYCAQVLQARMQDGYLDDAPIWDDVRTFDGYPWRRRVDIVSGGFPCQDLSCAGKRAGIKGERSGLWFQFARIIGEVRPRLVFLENVPGLLTSPGAMDAVLGSLASLGYDAIWDCIPATAINAPHRRDRWFALAHTKRPGVQMDVEDRGKTGIGSIPSSKRCTYWHSIELVVGKVAPAKWKHEGFGTVARPLLIRGANGLPRLVDRLRALGNAVVPAVVRYFLRSIGE